MKHASLSGSRRALAALGLSLLPMACGAEGQSGSEVLPLGQGQAEIADGKVDGENFAVVAIVSASRRSIGLCSGTLVAPNLVLTARHCVAEVEDETVNCTDEPSSRVFAPGNLRVSPSTSLEVGVPFFPVADILVPEGDKLCGADIALLILDGQFRADAIEPIAPRLEEPVLRGEALTAVGYGDTLEEGDGSGLRRIQDGLEVVCSAERCGNPEQILSTEFLGNGGVCSGDSGGPALDASGRVIGVASRGSEECDVSVYSSVPAWSEWIAEGAYAAWERGRYDTPTWLADFEGSESAPDRADEDTTGGEGQASSPPASSFDEIPESGEATAEQEMATPLVDEVDGALSARSSEGGCSVAAAAPGRSRSGASLAGVLAALALAGAFGRRRRPRR